MLPGSQLAQEGGILDHQPRANTNAGDATISILFPYRYLAGHVIPRSI
jgi:hypothetical protein